MIEPMTRKDRVRERMAKNLARFCAWSHKLRADPTNAFASRRAILAAEQIAEDLARLEEIKETEATLAVLRGGL
ncbi:hypothetical protein [Sphingomonas sp.]|uniref:hypothetical protein n=1 Tax=Sphingomonas sp. TaxID=28214 RepID=UPI0025F9EEE4|nr:hypothetical protein [Sphingomonas sp.]